MRANLFLMTNLIFLASCATNIPEVVDNSIDSSNTELESTVLKNDSFDGVQFFMDGMLFFEQGDYARAIIEFQDSIEAGSNSPEVYFNMSEAYWMLQKYDKSISLAKKAILLDDSAVDYKISLGKKYIALNNYELSLDVFNGIALKNPKNADVLFIIGDLKAELNDVDGALLYYQEAYNVDNELILALEVAAQLAYNSNHRDLPKIVKKLLLADPSNSEYMRGFLESKNGGNVEELIDLLELEELKANPFYNNLFNQIVGGKFVMIGNGKNKKSLAYIKNVVGFIDHCISSNVKCCVVNYADKPDLDMNTLVKFVRDKTKGKNIQKNNLLVKESLVKFTRPERNQDEQTKGVRRDLLFTPKKILLQHLFFLLDIPIFFSIRKSMKEKYQCPECGTKAMVKLQVFDRWWCTTCKTELDIDAIINEWATKGYSRKEERK